MSAIENAFGLALSWFTIAVIVHFRSPGRRSPLIREATRGGDLYFRWRSEFCARMFESECLRRAVANGAAFAFAAMALVGIPLDYAPGGDARAPLVLGSAAGLGLAAALACTVGNVGENRAARHRIGAWIVIRYILAFTFVRYGVAKLVGMQFFPRFYLLDARVIDMTPMNLAWSFFGHSYAYQAVSGALEVLGAILLCFRRTTTLGACILFGVMTNVVLVNFFFDVSVKLFSSVYLAMISYLLALEGRRFWAFFFTSAPPPPRTYLVQSPRDRRTVFVHLGFVALATVVPALDILREAASHRLFLNEPLLGAWAVESHSGLEDAAAWSKVYFEKGDYGFFRIDSRRVRFGFEFDEVEHRLRIVTSDGASREPLVGSLAIVGRSAQFIGTHSGRPFELHLKRELPR